MAMPADGSLHSSNRTPKARSSMRATRRHVAKIEPLCCFIIYQPPRAGRLSVQMILNEHHHTHALCMTTFALLTLPSFPAAAILRDATFAHACRTPWLRLEMMRSWGVCALSRPIVVFERRCLQSMACLSVHVTRRSLAGMKTGLLSHLDPGQLHEKWSLG